MFKPEEQGNFQLLYSCTHNNMRARYTFFDAEGNSLTAYWYTDYETDNGLELDDPNYEEYYAIAFQNADTKEYFEISYHNLPASVLCDGEKLY
ncbi:MAG: hypothetical protein Q4F00_10605 [bacterium]|nr:hypothetical protein [bacterium]